MSQQKLPHGQVYIRQRNNFWIEALPTFDSAETLLAGQSAALSGHVPQRPHSDEYWIGYEQGCRERDSLEREFSAFRDKRLEAWEA